MDLQSYLEQKFESWTPAPPQVVAKDKHSATLSWRHQEFSFLQGHLLYVLQRRERIPPWVQVYSGSKTAKLIDNLAPSNPHKFRLRVILLSTAVPHLAKIALDYNGDEKTIYEQFGIDDDVRKETNLKEMIEAGKGDYVKEVGVEMNVKEMIDMGEGDVNKIPHKAQQSDAIVEEKRDKLVEEAKKDRHKCCIRVKKWLESQWSEETCTSTDSDGTSAMCFCMAVRGGYLKQMQMMLEERPALIGLVNPTNGFTPLATAVRKGDTNTVRFLLSAGADVDQVSSTSQAPLHLAALAGHTAVLELLLDKGADFQARDLNELCVEHYAVDSGSLEMVRLVLDRGGDVHVRDNNGWTPLFRAVCQGTDTAMIEELVTRGSDVSVKDISGLELSSAARVLRNRHGRRRDAVLRLVDANFPHEQAVANFTRLTKKISRVHTLFKL